MILLWAFIAQIVAISFVVFVLKKILDHMLIDLAIRHLEYGQSKERRPVDLIVILTHRRLQEKYKQRIAQIIRKYCSQETQAEYRIQKDIMGGIIIKVGGRMIDYSLKDRLRQAVPWLFKYRA